MHNYRDSIVDNLMAWITASSDQDFLESQVFKKNMGFTFRLNSDQLPSNPDCKFVHCYFGKPEEGAVLMYLVADVNDTPDQEQWQSVIAGAPLGLVTFPLLGGSGFAGVRISPSEANALVEKWDEFHLRWIKNAIENRIVPFVLDIPKSDLEVGKEYSAFFGLETVSGTEHYFTLVIFDPETHLVIYPKSKAATPNMDAAFYNTVMPVPPYKPNGISKFYLHTIASIPQSN